MRQFKPKSKLKRFADRLFGYDYFVSYAWKDGREYAVKTAEALEGHGFDVFLDSKSYSTGDDWKQIGSWALSRTSQLILIVTEGAQNSKPVKRELEIFSKTGRRIIPIGFEKANPINQPGDSFEEYLPDEILRIFESNSISSGPSVTTIDQIIASFDLRRQSQKRLLWLTGALLILLVTTLLSVFFAANAYDKNRSLLEEQRVNKAQLLHLNSENLVDAQNKRVNLSSILAMKSYEMEQSAEALNRIRTNLSYTPRFENFLSFSSHNSPLLNPSLDRSFGRFILLDKGRRSISVFALEDERKEFTIIPEDLENFKVWKIHEVQLNPSGSLLAVALGYISELDSKNKRKRIQIYRIADQETAPSLIFNQEFNYNIGGYRNDILHFVDDSLIIASKYSPHTKSSKVETVRSSSLFPAVRDFEVSHRIDQFSGTSTSFAVGYRSNGDKKNHVSFYDMTTGKKIKTYAYRNKITDIVSDIKKNRYVVLVNRTAFVYQIEDKNIKRVRSIQLDDSYNQMCISEDGALLGFVGFPNHTDIYNIDNGRIVSRAETQGYQRGCAFSVKSMDSNSYRLATLSNSPSLGFWDIKNNQNTYRFRGGSLNDLTSYAGNSGFRIDESGEKIFVNDYLPASDQRVAVIYNIKDGRILSPVEHSFNGFSAIISPDGRYLAVEDDLKGSQFSVIDIEKNRPVFSETYSEHEWAGLEFFDFSRDGSVLVTSSQANEIVNPSGSPINGIRLWNTATGELINSFGGDQNYILQEVSISPDGSFLAANGASDGIYVWDVQSGELIYKIPASISGLGYGEGTWMFSFSSDSSVLAYYSTRGIAGSGSVTARRASDGSIIGSFPVSSQVTALTFDNSGKGLFVATRDGNVQVREVESFNIQANLKHENPVTQIRFNDAKEKFATLTEGGDGKARVWKYDDYRLADIVEVPFSLAINFSENGDFISAIRQNDVVAFNVSPDDLISELKLRLPENVSLRDWLTYFPGEPYEKVFPSKTIPSVEGNISRIDFDLLMQRIDLSKDSQFSEKLIYWIVKNNRGDLVDLYVRKGGKLKIISTAESDTGLDPLNLAMWLGHYDVFVSLYKHMDVSQYEISESPLVTGVNRIIAGQDLEVEKIVKYLISKDGHQTLLESVSPKLNQQREYLLKYMNGDI